jgi:hypothetical protein
LTCRFNKQSCESVLLACKFQIQARETLPQAREIVSLVTKRLPWRKTAK